MGRRPSQGPTDAELEILHILWREGPCTVRTVYEVLNKIRPTKYTTALKLLQIMLGKGSVTRDERHKTHVYKAKATKEKVQEKLLGSIIERFFEGSCSALIERAVRAKKPSKKELTAIRKIVGGF